MNGCPAPNRTIRPSETPTGAAYGLAGSPPMVPLGNCCRAIRGVTFPSGEAKPEPFKDSIPCLTTSAIQDEVAWDTARHIPARFMHSSDQELREGDLLVSTANSKALVGKLAMARSLPDRVTFGAFVTALRSLDNVLPIYLFHALRSEWARRYFFEKSSETTNISNLRTGDMLALEIPLPALAEQERIAAGLTAALAETDNARCAAQDRLAAAESLPAACLRDVFEREGERAWSTKRLGDLTIKIGSGITPRGGQSTYVAVGVPLIRSQNVHLLRFEQEGLAFITHAQDEEMSLSRVQPDDVLLNITGASIGRVCVVPADQCPANVNQHVSIIRSLSDRLRPDFLAAFLASPRFQEFIWENQAGATRQALTKEMIEAFEIPLPPVSEQARIATALARRLIAVEKLIARCREELTAIDALPAALLHKAFSPGD